MLHRVPYAFGQSQSSSSKGEVWGALADLQAAFSSPPPLFDIDVLLDNTAAIRSITGRASIS
ncbi:hypothetical protein E4U58_006527, partial [Claviceps cyperi]